jgi:hypothetical protein
VTSYRQLSDDALLERWAALDDRLNAIASERESLDNLVKGEGRTLTSILPKLLLSIAAAIAGLFAAGFTWGWGLLAAILVALYAALDIYEFIADRWKVWSAPERINELEQEASDVADSIEAIQQEIDTR